MLYYNTDRLWTLKLHIILAEAIEKYNLAASILYLKVNRDLRYHFNELVSSLTELVYIINTTLQQTDLVFSKSKSRLSQFDKTQWLSQAYIYNSIWDLSVKKSLRLNLFPTDSKSNIEKGTKTKEDWGNKVLKDNIREPQTKTY